MCYNLIILAHVFSCELAMLCNNQQTFVPKFFSMFIQHIEAEGLNEVGLYTRVDSENGEFIGKLCNVVDQGKTFDYVFSSNYIRLTLTQLKIRKVCTDIFL